MTTGAHQIPGGRTQTPCTDCGTGVTIHPSTDGTTPWRCGRCARTPLAQPVTPERTHAPETITPEQWHAMAETIHATTAYVRQVTHMVRRTRPSSTTRTTP